jgi:MoxR-like ATPase
LSGSGKTHLGKQVADASGLAFYMTGAVKSPFQLLGFVPANFTGESSKDCPTLRTPLRMAYEHGGVFAWDEIDASDASALVAFNALLDGNDEYAFPDGMVKRHTDFVCIASANTWGTGATADFVGRTKLDGATLARFQRIAVGYDETLERDLVGPAHAEWVQFVQAIRKAVEKEGIKVLVTPRHSLNGAALLAAGLPRSDVEQMTVFAGLDDSTVARLRAAA